MTVYTIKLRPLPQADDPDGIRRLRRALKALLRSYRLRCVGLQADPPDQEPGETTADTVPPSGGVII